MCRAVDRKRGKGAIFLDSSQQATQIHMKKVNLQKMHGEKLGTPAMCDFCS